ncbi:DUF600 family protein [Streptococcus sp. zg-86]|uniref:DUF600 family protein n=1 Tax=Streptococcus zhangguiae TaxID=2664091 RepID=A0ABW9R399_9STRE|nr:MULTISPECIES: immunity protein YezG family protein [unclassified Streptococcus]MTB63931.1 DUF600 family protein [Streptococcus sp. zg-86]MTB90242.1 DUF600 family protein [Streptococcus sp. zg-36]QTH46961.1 DUF600 family protein [Streptococcus sp. zg-86]
MTVENLIQEKIKELLQSIANSIPVEWDDLYVNVEMANDGGSIYFDFKSSGDEKYHYSLSIPNDFSIDSTIFSQLNNQQFEISRELWEIFTRHNMATWSRAIILFVNGKLDVKFDYAPWMESTYGPTTRRNFFKYQYLGFQPRTEKEDSLFKEMEEFQKKFQRLIKLKK